MRERKERRLREGKGKEGEKRKNREMVILV